MARSWLIRDISPTSSTLVAWEHVEDEGEGVRVYDWKGRFRDRSEAVIRKPRAFGVISGHITYNFDWSK